MLRFYLILTVQFQENNLDWPSFLLEGESRLFRFFFRRKIQLTHDTDNQLTKYNRYFLS